MAEYIERETALRIIDNYAKTVTNDGLVVVNAIKDIISVICPAADVEPVKRGEWISMLVKRLDWKGNMQSYYQPNTCSECHIGLTEKTNYCPNCGAKMDGKEVQE